MLAAVVLAGWSGAVGATVELPQDMGCYFIHGQRGWTVRWQARTVGEDGVFRLYAGQDLGNLRVVDLQKAGDGIGSYQYEGVGEGSEQLFYQLRYAAPSGDEIVLGTLRVDIGGMDTTPATVDPGGGGLKANQEALPHMALTSSPFPPHRAGAWREAAAPEPEVPPPRRAV